MYNFIICEDIKFFRDIYISIIIDLCNKLNITYGISIFDKYNNELEKLLNSSCDNKIYILDIVMPNKSGIEMAEQIRKNDLESLIIFITAYDEYQVNILNGDYMSLKYIDKSKNFKTDLYNTLYKTIMKNNNIITINTKDTFYRFDSKNITQIYVNKRKTYLKYDDNNTIEINLPLKNIKKVLGPNFMYAKRSALINVNQISNIDKVNKLITFKNSDITEVSKNNLKQILDELEKIN